MEQVIAPKKLIEVAIPLDSINAASAREKSIRHGHPSTLHLWWARRPLATARAVLFAQLVDDPSSHPDLFPTEEAQKVERARLFRIIEELVVWENTTKEEVLGKARAEIRRSWELTCKANAEHPRASTLFDPSKLPVFHDPFAGGGAIPLEAQRLGLTSYASDLNPVAVLINKAMIELPPKFAGQPPVNPEARTDTRLLNRRYRGTQGLVDDVRYYGLRMRDEAKKRIGAFYPEIEITKAMVDERPDLKQYLGQSLVPIAYLWARTVKSPDPAFRDVDVPLTSSFAISTKKGKEVSVEPVIGEDHRSYKFEVRVGGKPTREGTINRSGGGTCLLSGAPMPFEYLRAEGKAGRMGARLMAIVCEGTRGRVYLSPTQEIEDLARTAKPAWEPELKLPELALGFRVQLYGMDTFASLFTPRQLLALTTFSDLLGELSHEIERDAIDAGLANDQVGINDGGRGARAYADAVITYLGFVIDKCADYWSSICTWHAPGEKMRNTFSRQAIPMNWDYAETAIFSGSTGNWMAMVDWTWKALERTPGVGDGHANQADAQSQMLSHNAIVSTDPPYFDNIGYADLSDYFYVWLRHNLSEIYPDLFATVAVPKTDELIATPYRHGSKEKANEFFMDGMTKAMHRLAELSHPGFPITIYYALKQSETDGESGTTSTGWETFLEAVVSAGFAITGTWPMRTELTTRSVGRNANALASSIVLVCRRRDATARRITRSDFLAKLRAEFPSAFAKLQAASIAPVDLAQAAIGPGMAIFTSFAEVQMPDGRPLRVRDALGMINQVLDETLAKQEGDFEPQERLAIAWFEECGFDAGDYGRCETLSKAKNTSISSLVEGGVMKANQGKVRLLRPHECSPDWDPTRDAHLSSWEVLHQLIRALENDGEQAAASLYAKVPDHYREPARELAYRLYVLAERKGWASEALWYNSVIQSWQEIARLSRDTNRQISIESEF
ncbi:MAG: DUF1156 domain-containing protein [Ferrimicrobium sp.]|jgi:putative DNA methylase|nr:DUF1156 domain-containing protein [Ferrimicrobium sp.]